MFEDKVNATDLPLINSVEELLYLVVDAYSLGGKRYRCVRRLHLATLPRILFLNQALHFNPILIDTSGDHARQDQRSRSEFCIENSQRRDKRAESFAGPKFANLWPIRVFDQALMICVRQIELRIDKNGSAFASYVFGKTVQLFLAEIARTQNYGAASPLANEKLAMLHHPVAKLKEQLHGQVPGVQHTAGAVTRRSERSTCTNSFIVVD